MRDPAVPHLTATGDSTAVPLGQGRRARPCEAVRLSKAEAFDACQLLADADRCLVRAGHPAEAAALAELFDLIESRLCEREPGQVVAGDSVSGL
jgi:hypothetical protein